MMKQFKKYGWFFIVLVITSGCGKEKNYTVNFASTVTSTNSPLSTIEVRISSEKGLDSKGLLWSLDTTIYLSSGYYNSIDYPFGQDGRIIADPDAEVLVFKLENLLPNRTYYYRLFSVYDGYVKYSELESFETTCSGLGCGEAGGPIIYSDGIGGGIEVTAFDPLSLTKKWGCPNTYMQQTGRSVGTGQLNTTKIIQECGSSTLAGNCARYEQRAYSDYYMPSIDELQLIYDEIYVNQNNPYGWIGQIYMSSSEVSSDYCEALNFSTGETVEILKNDATRTTFPIRSF